MTSMLRNAPSRDRPKRARNYWPSPECRSTPPTLELSPHQLPALPPNTSAARAATRAVSQREPCDCLFVPLDALPRFVWNHEIAVLELERLGQYRVSPVLPLEPMRGIGDPHEMRSNFRVEVRGHWNAGGAGDRRRAQPTADAANAHEGWHDVVARAGKHRLIQQARTIEVLAELDRSLQLACKLRVARNIVVGRGFLEPVETLVVEIVTSHERVTERQALVEVAHELDRGAGSLAHGGDGSQVVG